MVLVKGAHEGHVHDSQFLQHEILDYPNENPFYMHVTSKVGACEYQVAFELYIILLTGVSQTAINP